MQPHNPIEHVVIIVKENHSFDNYFGSFPAANGASLPAAQDPPAGGDPPHDHAAWLRRATGAVALLILLWVPPSPLFSQVFILKGVKVICFHTLLQVLILKGDTRAAEMGEGKDNAETQSARSRRRD